MPKTYAQIQKQIDALSRQAEKLKKDEVAGVISGIKEAIKNYGLTAADLGLPGKRGPKKAVKVARQPARKGKSKSKTSIAAKYRDEAGNTWVGRGPRPAWLRDALASGKQLQDFAV